MSSCALLFHLAAVVWDLWEFGFVALCTRIYEPLYVMGRGRGSFVSASCKCEFPGLIALSDLCLRLLFWLLSFSNMENIENFFLYNILAESYMILHRIHTVILV